MYPIEFQARSNEASGHRLAFFLVISIPLHTGFTYATSILQHLKE